MNAEHADLDARFAAPGSAICLPDDTSCTGRSS